MTSRSILPGTLVLTSMLVFSPGQATAKKGSSSPDTPAPATKAEAPAQSPPAASVPASLAEDLMAEFGVDQARLDGLSNAHLVGGEIRQALSIAREMPGGINDDNLSRLITMRREQHLGWGRIARDVLGAYPRSMRRRGRPEMPPAPEAMMTGTGGVGADAAPETSPPAPPAPSESVESGAPERGQASGGETRPGSTKKTEKKKSRWWGW